MTKYTVRFKDNAPNIFNTEEEAQNFYQYLIAHQRGAKKHTTITPIEVEEIAPQWWEMEGFKQDPTGIAWNIGR